MRAAPRKLVAALCLSCAALAGCGAERPVVRNDDVRPDEATKTVEYPAAGIEAAVPARRQAERRRRPGVFRMALGDSLIAAYAYPREEPLPDGKDELDKAKDRLVAEVRGRDRSYELDSARTTRVAGSPAVELVGEQTISRAPVRIRSVHVYKGKAEYVFELLSPPRRYAAVNREAFAPMIGSLDLTGNVKPAAGKG